MKIDKFLKNCTSAYLSSKITPLFQNPMAQRCTTAMAAISVTAALGECCLSLKKIQGLNAKRFETQLVIWINDPTITPEEKEERARVAIVLEESYNSGKKTLALIDFEHITSLPEKALSYLTQLKQIDVHSCLSLTSITIPNTLKALKEISLYNCSALTSMTIPDTLTTLKQISLYNCSALSLLDPSLANLPSSCIIMITPCYMRQEAILEFQNAITRAWLADPSRGPGWDIRMPGQTTKIGAVPPLKVMIENYNKLLQEQIGPFYEPISEFTNFSEDNQKTLSAFLYKTQESADFRNLKNRNALLLRIYRILKECEKCLASTNPTDKELLDTMLLLMTDVQGCGDLLALTINRLEMACNLSDLRQNNSFFGFSRLLIGYRRLQLLHEHGKKIIENKALGDHVETFLYLQLQLKDALELPIQTQGMLYPGIAFVTDAELQAIQKDILEKTTSIENQIRILTEIETIPELNPWAVKISEIWTKQLQTDLQIQNLNNLYTEAADLLVNMRPLDDTEENTLQIIDIIEKAYKEVLLQPLKLTSKTLEDLENAIALLPEKMKNKIGQQIAILKDEALYPLLRLKTAKHLLPDTFISYYQEIDSCQTLQELMTLSYDFLNQTPQLLGENASKQDEEAHKYILDQLTEKTDQVLGELLNSSPENQIQMLTFLNDAKWEEFPQIAAFKQGLEEVLQNAKTLALKSKEIQVKKQQDQDLVFSQEMQKRTDFEALEEKRFLLLQEWSTGIQELLTTITTGNKEKAKHLLSDLESTVNPHNRVLALQLDRTYELREERTNLIAQLRLFRSMI